MNIFQIIVSAILFCLPEDVRPQMQVLATVEYAELWHKSILRCGLAPPGTKIQTVHWKTKSDEQLIFIGGKIDPLVEKPRRKFEGKNVTGRFGTHHSHEFHELLIWNPSIEDERDYKCILINANYPPAYGYISLKLVVPAKQMAIYVNNKKINESDCCTLPTNKIPGTETKVSVSCHVSHSRPFPRIDWEPKFANQSKNVSSIRKHGGVELRNLHEKIYVSLPTGKEWKQDLKCIALSPDPRTGEVRPHEMCVRLLPEMKIQDPWILRYIGYVGAIVILILLTLLISSMPDLKKQGVQFKWMKLSATCSAFSLLLITIGIASSQAFLVWAYELSNDQLSGRYTVMVRSFVVPAAICTSLYRLLGNILALFNIRARETEPMYRSEEGWCMRKLRFAFGMLSGPGFTYIWMEMANFLELDSETRTGMEDNLGEQPKFVVPYHHVRFFLRMDILGCLIALVHMFVFNFTASLTAVMEPPATFIMEGSTVHSVFIYISLVVFMLLFIYIYLIMQFGWNKFDRTEVIRTGSWRLYFPCLPHQSIDTGENTLPEETPLDDMAHGENSTQSTPAGN